MQRNKRVQGDPRKNPQQASISTRSNTRLLQAQILEKGVDFVQKPEILVAR